MWQRWGSMKEGSVEMSLENIDSRAAYSINSMLKSMMMVTTAVDQQMISAQAFAMLSEKYWLILY